MDNRKFTGLSGPTDLIHRRQQKDVEEKIYSQMEEVVESCRKHILSLYQQGKEISVEKELSSHLTDKYPRLGLEERINIAKCIGNELNGYGPLQELMDDKTVTDIVVVGPDKVVFEQDGVLKPSNLKFRSEAQLRLLVERLCYLGRRKVDESNPSVSLTLPEGYRVAISMPPLTESAHIAVRKFVYIGSIDGLVPQTFSAVGAEFLKKCTRGRLNIVFTGSMGTGKTTMIAVLGYEFSPLELPVLVEEVKECPLRHPYLRSYVSRPPNIEGKGEIKFDYILKHALQSRATRILVAEVRDGAIFYMLRGMATGQSGMGTLHAEDPKNAVQVQIPMLMGQAPEAAGMDQASRNLIIGSALDLVVHMGKEYDQVSQKEIRVCTHISVVQPSQGEPVQVKDIFIRRNSEMVATGYVPVKLIEKMKRHEINVPLEIFKN